MKIQNKKKKILKNIKKVSPIKDVEVKKNIFEDLKKSYDSKEVRIKLLSEN